MYDPRPDPLNRPRLPLVAYSLAPSPFVVHDDLSYVIQAVLGRIKKVPKAPQPCVCHHFRVVVLLYVAVQATPAQSYEQHLPGLVTPPTTTLCPSPLHPLLTEPTPLLGRGATWFLPSVCCGLPGTRGSGAIPIPSPRFAIVSCAWFMYRWRPSIQPSARKTQESFLGAISTN